MLKNFSVCHYQVQLSIITSDSLGSSVLLHLSNTLLQAVLFFLMDVIRIKVVHWSRMIDKLNFEFDFVDYLLTHRNSYVKQPTRMGVESGICPLVPARISWSSRCHPYSYRNPLPSITSNLLSSKGQIYGKFREIVNTIWCSSNKCALRKMLRLCWLLGRDQFDVVFFTITKCWHCRLHMILHLGYYNIILTIRNRPLLNLIFSQPQKSYKSLHAWSLSVTNNPPLK